MAITVIETITLTTPVGQGIHRKDFQNFLWVHIDRAPWRQQISFDVFGMGGLVILTPGDANGHTDVRVINQASGLTNIPVDNPGEQLIRGLYKETATDPGIEFWYSILVGGIDYNPSSTFPEKRDDFGPMKVPAVAADLPSIDYYQYLVASSTKSKVDLDVLKSLKETLTPKMILAKDINWLRNSITAVQRAYYDLKARLLRLENVVADLAERLGILERAFEGLQDFIYDELIPNIRDLEDQISDIRHNLLPRGLRSARNNTMKRVYLNLPSYGSGGPSEMNWAMKDPVLDSELYDAENSYSPASVGSNVLLDEYFKTLIVHSGNKMSSSKVVIQNNRIAMFRQNATEADISAGKGYEAMLSIGNNGYTVLDMAQASGSGTINIGKGTKLWMQGNAKGGWISAGTSPEEVGPGIAMTPQTVGPTFTQLALMAEHLTWTSTAGGSGLMNWGYGGKGIPNPYIYQTIGVGGDNNTEGFVIAKSQKGGVMMTYTGSGGTSCGINFENHGLKIWGLAEDGMEDIEVVDDKPVGKGMAKTPDLVQAILDLPDVHNDMYAESYYDPRSGISS